MDRISQLISVLFWACIVHFMNLRFERQFMMRIEREHQEVERRIGDFTALHEYVGRHRKVEFVYA